MFCTSQSFLKRFCVQRLRLSPKETADSSSLKPDEVKRNKIIRRAAKEFRDGMYGILSIEQSHI